MSQFTTELVVDKIGPNSWILLEKFEYHIGSYPSENVIKVPIGFITDFASIPKIFWSIIGPNGTHGKAAVLHDYCYATACYGKFKSDCIFLEAMKVLNVPLIDRVTLFTAVVLFGWGAWYKHRKEDKFRTKFK